MTYQKDTTSKSDPQTKTEKEHGNEKGGPQKPASAPDKGGTSPQAPAGGGKT